MANFKDIIGQEQIKKHLQDGIKSGNISHAYIINGEIGSGRRLLTSALTKTLLCENRTPDGDACGICKSCKQAESLNHPDVHFITHEKASIGIDDIREQLINDIEIKPYSSPYKIYIVPDANKMTEQAQNALLKTLEEPPEYAVILLLTTNVDTLLPTIQSRCVLLTMKPVRDELVKEFLMKDLKIPEYKADVCVAFARGNVGKAKALASSEEFDNIKSDAVTLLKYIHDMEISEIVAAIKRIAEYKFDINDYLDILSVWYRDVLLFKATNDVNHLIFRDEIQYIRKTADQSAYEGIEEILDALEKAKARLKANVNFDLTMELLLLTIKEN